MRSHATATSSAGPGVRALGATVLALALVLGGAVGNLIDRLVHGEVIDFLDFHIVTHYWPTFNLADSFIVLGVMILMMMTWLEQRQLKEDV